MIRDPLARKIAEELDTDLDPSVFEACAAALLKDVYPTLVPVKGGGDGGFDGEIGGEAVPVPLVTTTSKRAVENLRKNVRTAKARWPTLAQGVFATSRSLTPDQRKKLRDAADKEEVSLIGVHDASDFVERLYHDSRWRIELLGISGAPSALSAYPVSRRPLADVPLIGRDDVLAFVSAPGDRLVLGQPGMGKTCVLRHLVQEGRGLFVIDFDREKLADAIRDVRPKALLVDDAHARPDALEMLRHLRNDIGASFQIVAASWPRYRSDALAALQLDSPHVNEMKPLTRDVMVEVIRQHFPNLKDEWIHELLEQSAGRPGLAATLCWLLKTGGIERVRSGEALADDLAVKPAGPGRADLVLTLASLSIGGETGMPLEAVGKFVGQTPAALTIDLSEIAQGGVLSESSNGDATLYAVRPAALRDALVGRTFFGTPRPPMDELLGAAPDQQAVTSLLISSAMRGFPVPDALIRRRLEQDFTRNRGLYALLGVQQARWILETYSDQVLEFAEELLLRIPRDVLPVLLRRASSLNGTHEFVQAVVSEVKNWVRRPLPGDSQAIERREALLESLEGQRVEPWLLFRLASLLIDPSFESNTTAPGSGDSFILRSGTLTAAEVGAIAEFWPRVKALLLGQAVSRDDVTFDIVSAWSYPAAGATAEARAKMREVSRIVLRDLHALSGDSPGLRARARDIATLMEADLEFEVDEEFDALFIPERRTYDEYAAAERASISHARALGRRWSQLDPEAFAKQVAYLERERALSRRSWPYCLTEACRTTAGRVADPLAFAEAMAGTDCPPETIEPFLERLARKPEAKAYAALDAFSADSRFTGIVFRIAYRSRSVDANFFAKVAERLSRGLESLVMGTVARYKGSARKDRLLLMHSDAHVAAKAAVSLWEKSSKKVVPKGLRNAWLHALLAAPDYRSASYIVDQFPEALRSDLAELFFRSRLESSPEIRSRYGVEEEAVWHASRLAESQRLAAIALVRDHWSHAVYARALVGSDAVLFRALLHSELAGGNRMAPLERVLDDTWCQFVEMAMEAGADELEVVSLSDGHSWSWTGSEARMWADRTKTLEKLLGRSVRVDRIVKQLIERMDSRFEDAHAEEFNEAVYGRRRRARYS